MLVTLIVAAWIQSVQATPVSVHGVAYDSLHGAPLAAAFITISGGGKTKSATSDEQGRFQFDSVSPGAYAVSMQHAAIDSIGFPGFSTRATVSDGRAQITVAIPSFATLWRAACGGTAAPRDSGFVYGVVRSAITQKPASNASIDVSWVDLSLDKDKRVTQRRWRNQTRTDARGSYGVCGVPSGVALQIQALTDTSASGVINVAPVDARIQRRDLFVGPRSGGPSGTIAGMLTGADGGPFRDARVTLEALLEARSGADGRFVLRNVPAGTRQVEITAIGLLPQTIVVDVLPNDTATVAVAMRKVTTLDPVRVKAAARQREFNRELSERRRSSDGYFKDSTQVAAMGTIATVFETFPSTRVQRARSGTGFTVWLPAGASQCMAIVWIDGRRADFEVLTSIHPTDVALVEVYPHRLSVPMKFSVPGQRCGSIVIWTKYYVS